MNKKELTLLNIGDDLDSLMNLDPRGYGVCRILYDGARRFTGEPLCVNGAKGLVNNVKKGERVFILTGFVLLPWNEAETDGIISSAIFARFLINAFGAKPVMIVPEQCTKAIISMSRVLDFEVTTDIDNIPDGAVCIVEYTKSKDEEEKQADEILSHGLPCAIISNEAPGRNKNGYYHNAVGVNTTDYEAKYDVLFKKCQKLGIYNLSIGDLGNEIGMAAIEEHIRKYIPYAEKGGCKAGTGFGILSDTAADNIITATCSDWGCNALMAATAFLLGDTSLFHSIEDQASAMDAAAGAGMLDMYGKARPYIDGIGKNINLPLIAMMKSIIEYPSTVEDKTAEWFSRTIDKGFFE
ncbi:MAG: DUF4392 domain-containing protein [Eubacteriales bacterium]|nr:DUF4392 domain-containing protein [Eubacteriales bacterium]